MKFDFRKIFVSISILFLSFMVGFYGSRLVYYYKTENKKDTKDYTLIEYLTTGENLIKNNLMEDDNKYYFYKNTKNNYIYYSGLMYRILYIDKDTLYVITDECITNLKYGETGTYSDSEIKKWLEEVYLNNLDKTYLKNNEVKLLDRETYGKIGEKESFVINKDFWVLDNDEALVITEDGSLTKTSNYKDFLGVKPVIQLKGNTKYIKGDGSINNPYILDNKTINTTNDLYVGNYLKYKNIDLRVIEKNKDGIKVVTLNPIEGKHIFSNVSNLYKTNYKKDIGYYLNNEYIKLLAKNDLVNTKWYIGNYELEYKDTSNKNINSYVGLLKIGDYFITEKTNSYLITPDINDTNMIYTINDKNALYLQSINEELNIYPSFTLKNNLNVISGNGLKNNPYIIGD